jgi:uncharacterized protein YheU (UPF0270 family)
MERPVAHAIPQSQASGTESTEIATLNLDALQQLVRELVLPEGTQKDEKTGESERMLSLSDRCAARGRSSLVASPSPRSARLFLGRLRCLLS